MFFSVQLLHPTIFPILTMFMRLQLLSSVVASIYLSEYL
jgi:hypothetical protein